MSGGIDRKLLLIIVVLLLCGVVMVYSATSIMCAKTESISDSTFYLKKELVRVAFAVLCMVAATRIDYRLYKRYAPAILGLAVGLLILTTIPRFAGDTVKGAKRWVDFGVVSLQPSEFAKLALIVFLAEYFARKAELLDDFFRGFFPAAAVVGAVVLFIGAQPNYGMSVAVLIISVVLFLVAGVKAKHLVILGLPSIAALLLAIRLSEHAYCRIKTFFSGGDPLGDAFQINQSLIAIGAGGVFGKGIGNGVQKLFYLPEIHTDFIFSVIGEELGFIGSLMILLLFLFFAWRGLKIAMRAPDNFGRNLAVGITTMVFVYAALNIGVVLKMLPTTGIPLPFISYGGSALLVTMVACGILLNISSHVMMPLEKHIELEEKYFSGGKNARAFSGWRNRRTSGPGLEYCEGTDPSKPRSGHSLRRDRPRNRK